MKSTLRSLTVLAVALATPCAMLLICYDQASLGSPQPSGQLQGATPNSQPSLRPPPWQFAPADAGGSGWQPVQNEALLPPEFSPIPANRNPADLGAETRTPKSP